MNKQVLRILEMGRSGNPEPCSVKNPKSIMAVTGPGIDASTASLFRHKGE